MANVQIVTTNTVTHTTGFTLHKERAPVIKHVSTNYEHVREPVAVPRPRTEDLNALVVVHDKMEYYS